MILRYRPSPHESQRVACAWGKLSRALPTSGDVVRCLHTMFQTSMQGGTNNSHAKNKYKEEWRKMWCARAVKGVQNIKSHVTRKRLSPQDA